jgi:hypothetical protein
MTTRSRANSIIKSAIVATAIYAADAIYRAAEWLIELFGLRGA